MANFLIYFNRQFNAIGPLFLFICATFWPANFPGSEKQEGSNQALTAFFLLPKVEGRPKGPPFSFFATVRLFLENF